MRDPNRLYNFYEELKRIHLKHPDLRFGQIMANVERWLKYEKGIDDIFYIEEDVMLKYIKEFFNEKIL